MRTIFEQGYFNKYSEANLNESRSSVLQHSQYGVCNTTVFISHKHEDLEDLKGVLGFLQKTYGVKVYIDSQDPTMPRVTSPETALKIRERIEKCNKFILLATNGAIESNWCNWELGFGDARKFKEHIALFPMKPKGTSDSAYKGSEYMKIYPYISYFNGTEKYKSGKLISPGYYVRWYENTQNYITPLAEWLKKR